MPAVEPQQAEKLPPVVRKWEVIISVMATLLILSALVFKDISKLGAARGNTDEFLAILIPDFLLALLIGLLGFVLFVCSEFRHVLQQHATAVGRHVGWLAQAEQQLASRASTIDSILAHTQAWAEIREMAVQAGDDALGTTILQTTNELALKWANHICKPMVLRPYGNEQKKKDLERLCWVTAFQAYMREECRDMSGDRYGPKMATNYPTYLSFLRDIAKRFVEQCRNLQLTPVFIAVANTLPAEWVMICDRQGNEYYCETSKGLAQWRSTSESLAKNENVVFKRLFVVAEQNQVRLTTRHRIPLKDEFMRNLGVRAVYAMDDESMEYGLLPDEWDRIWIAQGAPSLAHEQQFVIRQHKRGFRLTSEQALRQPKVTLFDAERKFGLKPLKTVIDDLHGAIRPVLVTVDQGLIDAALGQQWLVAWDLLVIGILKDDTNATTDNLTAKLDPLLGIECRARELREDLCMLALYAPDVCNTHVMPWVSELEKRLGVPI